jgi:hypothetical protein
MMNRKLVALQVAISLAASHLHPADLDGAGVFAAQDQTHVRSDRFAAVSVK